MPRVHKPQPFLKWAGGKSQLLEQYAPFFPRKRMRSYCEPFVGSGALFFYLRERDLFKNYHLSDANEELINCYRVVRDDVFDLIQQLEWHKEQHSQHGEEHYYEIRAWDRKYEWQKLRQPVERAARMIYLNKTCYNGLWRVNSQGHFNVPMGRYVNPNIVDKVRLKAAARSLSGVELNHQDFESAVSQAGSEDFVYFDPPYAPVSQTANFTSYAADDFGEEQQERLANVFADLTKRDCRVMLSNSDVPSIIGLYAFLDFKTLQIQRVEARRAINSRSGNRGMISEILILNY